ANVIVIVADVLAFVFRDTQKNESQEYQFFGIKFRRKIGVCVYTFLCVKIQAQDRGMRLYFPMR
ncbi:MAG: hypothetical protein KKG76_08085, partial [Euryarchaeota archaeon]|nr:hypothetical protein [Euryarchaeota archaeon]